MDHFPLSWGRPRNDAAPDMFNASSLTSYRPQNWEAKAFEGGRHHGGGQHASEGAVSHTQ